MIFRQKVLSGQRATYLRLRAWANARKERGFARQGVGPRPAHLTVGERGEDLAYFYLRDQGFTVVARRWHSARLRGDLDLVAWDGDTLAIVEVKTRTAHDFAPAASAVDEPKRRMLRRMAVAYRRRLPEPWRDHIPLRFDILSVYDIPGGPEFGFVRNAFPATHSPWGGRGNSAGERGV